MKKYRSVAAIIVERENQYLLVRKPRKSHAWQFPQGGVDEGETFLEAAKRELAEECGGDLQVEILSNKVAEYQYDFPSDFLRHHGEFAGASVTFFKAKYISGEPEVDNSEIVEARWCEKEEIQNLVEKKYWEVVKGML
jgi:8-oxo-dGTP pyrophosphatase MutT (NUDIX family)